MPILHYPPVIGGFEIYSQNIAEGIGKTDDVFVVTCRVVNVPNREIKDKLRLIRTSPWVLKNLSYSKPWFILGSMLWILIKSFRIIKKEKIDLIHAQGFLSGILSFILKKTTKTPYILTIQSADFSVYHPRLNINIIKFIYKKMEKLIFENADFCHAVSRYLENHFKNYNVKKTAVVPNGVSKDKFKPDANKKATRKELGLEAENLIVCVSRLEHKNGTHDLIKAVDILNRRYTQMISSDVTSEEYADTRRNSASISVLPKAQNQSVSALFKIIICGDGSEMQKLEKMVKDFNLGQSVLFLGDILHKDLPKYVACGDIFIRPSLAEGFGIVFLEAMAAGLAVIGTPVGGIPDFLHNNETGLFCEPRNPEDIAQKIELLIMDKNLRRRLIENGLRIVKEEYLWDKIVNRIKNLYYEALIR